jgi:4-amino-4-deoxy-L-arabinose transferase-like glycosyltransferase
LLAGLVVPPFENLDEIEHLGVIRYVADTGRLPVHGTPAAERYHYRQEASQPPLYYLLSAAWVRLLDLPTGSGDPFPALNPWVACGMGGAGPYDNRAVFHHDPHDEAFPWQGTLLTLHVLRIGSTLLQLATVIGTYVLARRALPRHPLVAPMATAVVAFNPQFLLVASGINNDNLVTPLATWGLILILAIGQEGLTFPRALGLGIIGGLAGLSKLSGWFLLILAGVVVLLRLLRVPGRRVRRALTALLIPTIALLVAGWWLWRNWQLYGDPTALAPMLEWVGVRDAWSVSFAMFDLMFRSFWGQLPCAFYPPAFYVPYLLLVVAGVGGLIWGWRKLTRGERGAALLMAAWFGLIGIGWMRWDALTPATGGRLLFPALPAVALLITVGLVRPAGKHFPVVQLFVVSGLFLLALGAVGGILPAFFSPPPRYADDAAVQPEHELDARLGESIRLLGYDVSLRTEDDLQVTLYWQALDAPPEDYTLALQLVSAVPGDTTLRWNYNSWPGHGNYPTSAWRVGEVIEDRYHFHLPSAPVPTQAWDLHLILYQGETGVRLPVHLSGTYAGDELVLERLRLAGEQPLCPPGARLETNVQFGASIALTHATVLEEEELVVLCWRALEPPADEYTVFVHLQDAAGELLATGDGPPMGGGFPTSLWQSGDVIRDVHPLEMAEEGEIYVGLYRPEDGSRLPATIDGMPVPHEAVLVGVVER